MNNPQFAREYFMANNNRKLLNFHQTFKMNFVFHHSRLGSGSEELKRKLKIDLAFSSELLRVEEVEEKIR
jgi:hypothetical protein